MPVGAPDPERLIEEMQAMAENWRYIGEPEAADQAEAFAKALRVALARAEEAEEAATMYLADADGHASWADEYRARAVAAEARAGKLEELLKLARMAFPLEPHGIQADIANRIAAALVEGEEA